MTSQRERAIILILLVAVAAAIFVNVLLLTE